MRTSIHRVDGHLEANDSSFPSVLAQYRAELYGFARHLTRDRAEARDLYQQIVRRAFLAFDEQPRPANWRTWLLTIATDIVLSDTRYSAKGSLREEQAGEVRGTSPLTGDQLDDAALRHAVARIVTMLPRREWVAFVQRAYLDLGYAEIAETLCSSEGEARTSVYAALKTMRAQLEDRL